VLRISLVKKHSVPTFIISALEDLVRRPEPLFEREITNLSGKMVARLGVARERYLRGLSRMFAFEKWMTSSCNSEPQGTVHVGVGSAWMGPALLSCVEDKGMVEAMKKRR
jgi:hypothetical protein